MNATARIVPRKVTCRSGRKYTRSSQGRTRTASAMTNQGRWLQQCLSAETQNKYGVGSRCLSCNRSDLEQNRTPRSRRAAQVKSQKQESVLSGPGDVSSDVSTGPAHLWNQLKFERNSLEGLRCVLGKPVVAKTIQRLRLRLLIDCDNTWDQQY